MKQSQHDPTLKEYSTEREIRQWIRHLEKIIEDLERREKAAKLKNATFAEKNTQLRRKYKRLITRVRFLQKKYPEIDFGLGQFSKEHGD